MRGEHAMTHRYRRLTRLSALTLGLALAGTGVSVAPAAGEVSLDGTAPPPPALRPSPAALPDPDCLGADITELEGSDDRCETWTAVYDDPELYDNSLSTYLGEPMARDEVHQLAVSPTGGRVFTFGMSCRESFPALCRWAVVAHRADTGDQLWVAQEWATGISAVTLVGIAVSADGERVYAAGVVGVFTRGGDWDPLINTDVLTIAWDARDGRKLWERTDGVDPIGHREGDRHDLHAHDAGVALAVDPVGDRIYVTGYSDNRDTFYDVLVIAYDGTTGTPQWVATDDTSTAERRYADDRALPHLAQVSPDGETLYLAAGSGARLLAYQAHDPKDPAGDGTLRWVRELDGTPDDLDVAPDGSRIYLRHSNRIAAYEAATGAQAWPDPPQYQGFATDLAVSPTGDQIYVTGGVPGLDDALDYGTIAYDAADGQQAWLARWDGWSPRDQRNDSATAVAVSPDGARVYVTGTSTTPGTAESASDAVTGQQATVAHDAATGGEPLWGAMYSRPLDGEAHGCFPVGETGGFLGRWSCVAVGPDGTVYTAGTLSRFLESTTPAPTKNGADWGVQAYTP